MNSPPPIQTRKPTGLPSWPILLLAGVEKSGKSYAAATASGSDLIGRTYWVSVGEDDPDDYGPLGDFEIVLHDGTYRGILNAVAAAVAQPPVGGKPNLIVLDSAGRIWALLSDAAQQTANERAARKGKNVGDGGADITMDLWNTAKQRWGHILDTLRAHQGPVVVTARLEEVTAMENGQPTKAKTWKVQAEKNLPFEVGAIIQLRKYCEAYLTGVRSLRYRPTPGELTPLPDDWTIEGLWRQLGLADTETGPRHHSDVTAQGADAERDALVTQVREAAEAARVPLGQVAQDWAQHHDGQPITEATDLGSLELLRDDLRAAALAPNPSGPGPEEPPETGEAITDKTRKALFALFGEVGISTDDDQRAFLTDTLGREVASRSTLTEAEGIAAGKRLRRIQQGDPDAEWAPTFDAEVVS